MKKKTILVIFMFLAILTLFTGCRNSNKNNVVPNEEQNKSDTVEYKSYVLGWDNYGSWKEDINNVIISNTDELQKFCIKLENEDESYVMVDRAIRSADLFKDYNEEYFKSKSLAILGVDIGNGNQHINLKKATKENNSVKIEYEIATSNETGITVMRKCFIVAEIDKDITNIIRVCNTPEYSYTDVSLCLKPNTLTSKGATFIIKNNSKSNYNYGAEYEIEIKKDGKWQKIELDEPLVWNSLAYTLNGKEQRDINIDFTYGYGELSKGQYRLVKKVFKENEAPVDVTKYQYIYADFEIAENNLQNCACISIGENASTYNYKTYIILDDTIVKQKWIEREDASKYGTSTGYTLNVDYYFEGLKEGKTEVWVIDLFPEQIESITKYEISVDSNLKTEIVKTINQQKRIKCGYLKVDLKNSIITIEDSSIARNISTLNRPNGLEIMGIKEGNTTLTIKEKDGVEKKYAIKVDADLNVELKELK